MPAAVRAGLANPGEAAEAPRPLRPVDGVSRPHRCWPAAHPPRCTVTAPRRRRAAEMQRGRLPGISPPAQRDPSPVRALGGVPGFAPILFEALDESGRRESFDRRDRAGAIPAHGCVRRTIRSRETPLQSSPVLLARTSTLFDCAPACWNP